MLIEPLGCWSHQPHSLQPTGSSAPLMLLMALTSGAANTASPPSVVTGHRTVPSSTAKGVQHRWIQCWGAVITQQELPLPGRFSSTPKRLQNNPKTGPGDSQTCQIGDLFSASGLSDIPPYRTEPKHLVTCSLSTSSLK